MDSEKKNRLKWAWNSKLTLYYCIVIIAGWSFSLITKKRTYEDSSPEYINQITKTLIFLKPHSFFSCSGLFLQQKRKMIKLYSNWISSHLLAHILL